MNFFDTIPERCIRVWLRDMSALEEWRDFAHKCGYEARIEGEQLTFRGQVTGGIVLGMDPITAFVQMALCFFGPMWPFISKAKKLHKRVDPLWKETRKKLQAEHKETEKVREGPKVKQQALWEERE